MEDESLFEDEFWFEDESWFREEIMEEITEICPLCGGSGLIDGEEICFMCLGHGFIES